MVHVLCVPTVSNGSFGDRLSGFTDKREEKSQR
ncbi:hypothetical protein Vch1786_I1191 [Vibrio cholerae O1 str. 2010EL-1786]|uniref:Uncharacterized protein n=2 Tax=Vibrio cholerae TaxID=666 RepID=Q9KRF1_VIBCH|nr:hypothetical protein VC_1691 [Vibrio cholerae O1 biovar El Tor str. N16961]ACP05940.1 conserved hypothetical protein [Vibrio cholerae M66-2]ACP09807.1 conserved hypothetical protein [Vibrio cholerae O395]AET26793.1 hypothetical protein Vch1786_I1191 [Vibrio cholerae O1 str. 2010EL-1786]